jgi:hypothetical protein
MKSTENSNDFIGNRTCDLPACSIVPQPTALPRAPKVYGFTANTTQKQYEVPNLIFCSVSYQSYPPACLTFQPIYTYLPACLPVSLPAYRSDNPSSCKVFSLSISLYIYLFLHQSSPLSIYHYTYLSIYLLVSMHLLNIYISMPVYLHINLSI